MEIIKGKTALITGSAKRLGREIAISLAQNGVHIIIHYNSSKDEAQKLERELLAFSIKTQVVQANLSLERDIDKLAEITNYDFLINNASIYPKSTLKRIGITELIENFTIHSFAPLLLAKSFLKKKRQGSIINIIDCKIDTHHRTHTAYHLSKKSLKDVTEFLAKELAPGVRVNAIAPGLVIPPEASDPNYTQGVIEINPLRRIPTVKEISDTVLFLLKNQSITGQTIYVDGGRSLNA